MRLFIKSGNQNTTGTQLKITRKICFFIVALAITPFVNAQEFITVWKTDNPGASATNQVTVPGPAGAYTIYWEHTTNPSINGTTTGSGNITLTFPAAGLYRIKMMPVAPNILMDFNTITNPSTTDAEKLITVEQWGTSKWNADMRTAFFNCVNMDITATDIPDFSGVTNMSGMFTGCKSLIGNPTINNWNTALVNDMAQMFMGANQFNQPLGSWNTSNVKNFGFMFASASQFNQPLANWNTGSATSMAAMFSHTPFNQPIASWNTSNVQYFSTMFNYAVNFNQPLDAWDMGKAIDISGMFQGAHSFNQPLNSWNTVNVTNMNSVFHDAPVFNQPLDQWNTAKVTSMVFMFRRATVFNFPLNSWNTANVVYMKEMFEEASTFNQPLDQWNTGNVIDMNAMFYQATSFNQPLNTWNTGKVTNMGYMFAMASSFNQSLASWDLSSINLSGGSYGYSLYEMLTRSGLDCINYDATLTGWASSGSTPNNMVLGAIGRIYSATTAVSARNSLISTKGWTITGDTYNATCNTSSLPVVFGPITATLKGGHLNILWSTLKETNNSRFEIEASGDGVHFVALGSVNTTAVSGNSDVEINYRFQTTTPAIAVIAIAGLLLFTPVRGKRKWIGLAILMGILISLNIGCQKSGKDVLNSEGDKLFLRIAQIDIDGTKSFSKAISVTKTN
ncbi:BspA family leucine-rich repeat surface protein [Niabella sp. CJ426]|uniref:BspA family leucine-rich repeat surface protein n=1 Tax=Niabella sp. CJ426 TaxID=3393740 RepID=UPI003D01E984